MQDYLYDREKKMDRDDAVKEWFEAHLNDVILEYCNLFEIKATSENRKEAKEFLIRALKNV